MDQQQATKRFYSLVWPHLATVLRTAQFLTGNSAEAEDIAQVTMMKAFKSIDSLQDGTDTKAWLMTILRNTRIDHLRSTASSARNVSLEQLAVEPMDSSTDAGADAETWQNPEQVLQAFSDQQVIDALLELPEEIRWTLLLVDVEQMDHKDAAKILDVPVGTVKSRTHRGRAMLREFLLPVAREMRLVRQEGEP
ncbi:MAG: sigma-70 family RNA polymerase sigma factor [Bacillota bacterium]